MLRPRWLALVLLVVLATTSVAVEYAFERDFGAVSILDMKIELDNGRSVSFSVYRPSIVRYEGAMPAIVTIHGITASRESMRAYNIELARRNFTVVSVDLAGHGISSETFGINTFYDIVRDVYEAVRYVQLNDEFTSDSTYGVVGHSLGAGIALLLNNMPVIPNATVIIGGGMGFSMGGITLPLNMTTPHNLLLASGIWDELITPATAIETLRTTTGLPDALPGITYGEFLNGTARRLVLAPTNHLFETTNSMIVSECTEWMIRSLQGSTHYTSTLSPASQIYHYADVAGTVASVSFVLSLFPLYLIIYSKIPQRWRPSRHLTHASNEVHTSSLRRSTVVSLVNGIIFLVVLLFGFVLDFNSLVFVRVSFGTGLTLYSIFTFIIIVSLLRLFFGDKQVRMYGLSYLRSQELSRDIPRAILSLLPLIGWMILWSVVTMTLTGTKIGYTPQIIGGSVTIRALYTVFLTFVFLPLFYSDKIWLNIATNDIWSYNGPMHTVMLCIRILTFRFTGWAILLTLLYVPFLFGVQLGFLMFVALLVLAFMIVFGVITLLGLWVSIVTHNDTASALSSGLLLAVIVASTFQLL